jgi:hypothetical protein
MQQRYDSPCPPTSLTSPPLSLSPARCRYGCRLDEIRSFIQGGWEEFDNNEGDLSHLGPLFQLSTDHFVRCSVWPLFWLVLLGFSSVQFSSVQFRSVQISSVQIRSDQISSVQFSSVQFSSVQFSSVQFSSIQIRSVQISSDQIRSVQIRSDQIRSVQFSSVQSAVGIHAC